VRENRRDGADIALGGVFGTRLGGRFCGPDGGVKMFDENLVDAVVGVKDLDRGAAELGVKFELTGGHGAVLRNL